MPNKKSVVAKKIAKSAPVNKKEKVSPKLEYIESIGRRKAAVARVRIFAGKVETKSGATIDKGEALVNDIAISKYFPFVTDASAYNQPLSILSLEKKFAISAKITGGGKNSQLDAYTLALARALQKSDYEHTSKLRELSLLTVDARVRERRKVGTGGKARRQKQSPKR